MARNETFGNWLLNRGRKVHISNAVETRTRIKSSGLVTGGRQFNERYMLTNCNCFRSRCYLTDQRSRLICGERQRGFDFCVLRKILCIREIERAATGIQSEGALLRALKCGSYLMHVAEIEVCSVYERSSALLGSNLKPPQGRFSKSIFNCLTFVRIVGNGAKVVIRSNEQNAWSNAFEPHNVAFT